MFGCTRWNAWLGWYEGHNTCYTHHTDLSGVFSSVVRPASEENVSLLRSGSSGVIVVFVTAADADDGGVCVFIKVHIQYCLEYFGFQHPDLELNGGARSVVQFDGILPEAAPGIAYSPVDLDGQAGVVVNVPPR